MEIKVTYSMINNKSTPAIITITGIDLSNKKQVEQLKKSIDQLSATYSIEIKPNENPQYEKE